MANYVRFAGIWREATDYCVKVDGVWICSTQIWVKVDGDWKQSIPFVPPVSPPPPPTPPPPPPTGGGGGTITLYYAYCNSEPNITNTLYSDTSGCAVIQSQLGNPCNFVCGASPVGSASCSGCQTLYYCTQKYSNGSYDTYVSTTNESGSICNNQITSCSTSDYPNPASLTVPTCASPPPTSPPPPPPPPPPPTSGCPAAGTLISYETPCQDGQRLAVFANGSCGEYSQYVSCTSPPPAPPPPTPPPPPPPPPPTQNCTVTCTNTTQSDRNCASGTAWGQVCCFPSGCAGGCQGFQKLGCVPPPPPPPPPACSVGSSCSVSAGSGCRRFGTLNSSCSCTNLGPIIC